MGDEGEHSLSLVSKSWKLLQRNGPRHCHEEHTRRFIYDKTLPPYQYFCSQYNSVCGCTVIKHQTSLVEKSLPMFLL